MSDNGDKILEVVRLFIDNINETTKSVDRVEKTVNEMADSLKTVIRTIKIVLAVFGIAILLGAIVVKASNKGWLSPPEKEIIVQPAPNKEELKNEILKDIFEELKKDKGSGK